jgi:NADH-quinone oxidoreductase subunit E
LSFDAMRPIAELLDVPESEVFGAATFYSLFRWKSGGRHVISVCHNLSCSLLGVEEGQVTEDGRFSYRRIECIGRCDGAPAMLVDDDYHGELTSEKTDELLARYY